MMQYVSPKAEADFMQRYPAAYAFLVHHSLIGEKLALQKELDNSDVNYMYPGRRDWIKSRLAELEHVDTQVQS